MLKYNFEGNKKQWRYVVKNLGLPKLEKLVEKIYRRFLFNLT